MSGTDPVTGAPYAPEYTGLPTELTALQARLLEDAEESKQVTDLAEIDADQPEETRQRGASRLSDGLDEISGGGKQLADGSEPARRRRPSSATA